MINTGTLMVKRYDNTLTSSYALPITVCKMGVLMKISHKTSLTVHTAVKQRLVSNVLYQSTDIIIILSPVFSGGWLFLLWANTLNCSMQMRAITKLLGEEMTAEVGFIGGLTQLSWKPHRIMQLSNGYNLMLGPEIASTLLFVPWTDPYEKEIQWLPSKLSICVVQSRGGLVWGRKMLDWIQYPSWGFVTI